MKTKDMVNFFADFYPDFRRERAEAMCRALGIGLDTRVKTMSKGTKEKLQLLLVMSRAAKLYLLDEPIAGVDPAARDFILQTILTNYSPKSTVLISTHLIADIEPVLDEVIFLKEGRVVRHDSTDNIRGAEGKSVDEVFREVFRTIPMEVNGRAEPAVKIRLRANLKIFLFIWPAILVFGLLERVALMAELPVKISAIL